MYERFSDRARKVMQTANQIAQRLNCEFIEPQHVLAGILDDVKNVACGVLRSLACDPRALAVNLDKSTLMMCHPTPERLIVGKLSHVPKTKELIISSIEESRTLGHNYVGTEHMLLAAVRVIDHPMIATMPSLENIRQRVVDMLRDDNPDSCAPSTSNLHIAVGRAFVAWATTLTDSELAEIGLARIDRPNDGIWQGCEIMSSPIKGTHPAVRKLINALGIDTKVLFTSRVVIDIKCNDAVRAYIHVMPTEKQVSDAVNFVDVIRLDAPEADFAEVIEVDSLNVDDFGKPTATVEFVMARQGFNRVGVKRTNGAITQVRIHMDQRGNFPLINWEKERDGFGNETEFRIASNPDKAYRDLIECGWERV